MRILFALSFVVCAAISPAGAEDLRTQRLTAEFSLVPTVNTDTVYKPLTTWEKVKLGAAYFTDPQRIRDTEIVYEYSPMSFGSEQQLATLDSLANEGKILCTINNLDHGSKWIKLISCERVPNFPAASASFQIISPDPSLLDKKPSGVLVSESKPFN